MARTRAASRRGGSGEAFRVDASEFKALNDRLKQADKKVARQMRKVLKAAADDAVRAVQDAALAAPPDKVGTRSRLGRRRKPSTRVRSRGMRQALAKATRSSLTNSKTTATLRVTTSQRRMPAGIGPMVKAWNSRRFRHPVFGNRKKWAEQNGSGYFTEGTREQRDPMLRNLARAMEQVAEELM